jgi:SsrA-binding protein
MGDTVAVNRKARHDFKVEDTLEAGIALTGTEIKSIRKGDVNLQNAFARIEHGEAWLIGMHVAPWGGGSRYNHEPRRERKLLLHRAQIDQLVGKIQTKGMTLVPLSLYVNDRGKAKIQLGVARGKQNHDRRRDIAARDARRDMEREIADATRGR